MGAIYTISHPITNEIVYVGASNNFDQRAYIHIHTKSKTLISEYVCNLKAKGLLPKIEVLDLCDEKDLFLMERYWINQLSVWGFNLFNKHKIIKPPKSIYYSSSLNHNSPFVKERKSKKWSMADLDVGAVHEIERNKRDIFVISFRKRVVKFKLQRYLDIVKKDDKLICTVKEGVLIK